MQTNNKMREVVKALLDALYDMGIDEETVAISAELANCHMNSSKVLEIIRNAKAVLAEPVRNCDVGTAEEQSRRFCAFCRPRLEPCDGCPCLEGSRHGRCEFVWAQMPYEEGGAK